MSLSFPEMQKQLSTANLRELIVLTAGGIDGRTFNELAALRERFLDVAFRDAATPFNSRSVAAAWARALDSALMIMLETSPQTLQGYVNARAASMDALVRFGFGSAGWGAIADGGDLDHVQHAHLVDVAFGAGASQRPAQ